VGFSSSPARAGQRRASLAQHGGRSDRPTVAAISGVCQRKLRD
jgi:hypothetical protein